MTLDATHQGTQLANRLRSFLDKEHRDAFTDDGERDQAIRGLYILSGVYTAEKALLGDFGPRDPGFMHEHADSVHAWAGSPKAWLPAKTLAEMVHFGRRLGGFLAMGSEEERAFWIPRIFAAPQPGDDPSPWDEYFTHARLPDVVYTELPLSERGQESLGLASAWGNLRGAATSGVYLTRALEWRV